MSINANITLSIRSVVTLPYRRSVYSRKVFRTREFSDLSSVARVSGQWATKSAFSY
ncbi:Uncharacterised protein [Mycobacteroides abscessus]|nr:Uncharacterised protein [Mycobacteroides abscessus]SHV52518.1 Uncharacterised protein [Mycobacteroides abscessus subsp. abscessus]